MDILPSKPMLKVLHIRRTRRTFHIEYRLWDTAAELSALDTFARWAFGPHGLPMLELLAYGDFSKGYPSLGHSNELFCRASKEVEVRRNISSIPLSYRRSEFGYNKVLDDLNKIDAPMAMLSACPLYGEPFYQTFVMPFSLPK